MEKTASTSQRENSDLEKLVNSINLLHDRPNLKSQLLALLFRHTYRPVMNCNGFDEEHRHNPVISKIIMSYAKNIKLVNVELVFDDCYRKEILAVASGNPEEEDVQNFLSELKD